MARRWGNYSRARTKSKAAVFAEMLNTTEDTVKAEAVSIDLLPDQSGNAGLFLTTDGSVASWAVASGGVVEATGGSVYDITLLGTPYRLHVFTSSGTFNVITGGLVDVIVIGGGGGSSNRYHGGGGAGGMALAHNFPVSVGALNIVVGAGGSGSGNGGDSKFGTFPIGKGGGSSTATGQSGGCGGGGGHSNPGNPGGGSIQHSQPPHLDVSYYGHGGGTHRYSNPYPSGGGGGIGGSGQHGSSGTNGGAGKDLSGIVGTGVGENGWFGSGGVGGHYWPAYGMSHPSAPSGGGGNYNQTGQANTGGGGGAGQAGGSGIVIVRYPI